MREADDCEDDLHDALEELMAKDAEIERLRAGSVALKKDEMILSDSDIGKIMKKAREDAIEECARAIEQEAGDQELIHVTFATQTIRALKSNTGG